MNMLSIDDLKTIRVALSSAPLNRSVITTLDNVDKLLATHNIKAVYKSKPRRPYQRQAEGEYVFEEMTAHDHEVLQHKTDLVTRNI